MISDAERSQLHCRPNRHIIELRIFLRVNIHILFLESLEEPKFELMRTDNIRFHN
jgi:hypothetical protein